ncbi:MAG: RecX family transcriptional regulator [Bacteroidaceae bacterium]|nr:RecX family transcriptional regulator [Bacteroidaceae bacterium]
MEKKKKKLSESEAFNKLSALCATAEYCRADMMKKMSNWELPYGCEDNIISRLIKERYIDESRYAKAFTRDKFRYNGWGMMRIERELRIKGIDNALIEEAKSEIDETENDEMLRRLIEGKRRTVKGKSEYEIKAKLMRYAVSKGFTMESIYRIIGDLESCLEE